VTFNPATNVNDRIVFRAKVGSSWTYNGTSWVKDNAASDTDAQTAVRGGCVGVADGSTNLSTCVKNNNTQSTPPATFYPVTGGTPHTTYWNRVAYVKNFTTSPLLIDDKVWSCTLP
jgi:hypothetical protein